MSNHIYDQSERHRQETFEMWKQHRETTEKYAYFVLAAAASAIGFVVARTDGQKLSWWVLPAAISVGFWLASFVCGCLQITKASVALKANLAFLQLRGGIHPSQPTSDQRDAMMAVAFEEMGSQSGKAQRYITWQFRCLMGGAFFFVAWEVLEMIHRTYWSGA